MSRVKPHIIRTQRVEVTFENPEDVFECKNHLAEVCKSKLLPALEKLFDEKVGPKKIISIDKLYVDAGVLDKENWENKWVETVIHQLSRYLDGEVTKKNTGKKRKDEGIYGKAFNDSGGFVTGEGVSMHEEGKEMEMLLYFLQRGVLPWYASIQSKAELQQQFTSLMASHDFQQQVNALIEADETAFERLVYHTKEDSIFTLIGSNDERWDELKELKKSWYRIFAMLNLSPSRQKHLFFSAIYQVLVKKAELKVNAENITLVIVELLEIKEREQLIELAEKSSNHHFTQEEIKISQCIEQYKEAWKKDGKTIDKTSKEATDTKSGKKSVKATFDEENLVFITNAGLVLLHPFLRGLFENVGYTDNNQWISEEVHQRSLILSQYLVTGTDESPEFDLFLNKILTGYPLEASLPVDIELSAFEKGEAADLLQSVINHWKALKNTSVQGLQNTFLQREGKIVKKESGWLLQVEQKAFDILLDKIPWGFSTIKTPWMDEILSVEWA